MGYSVIDGQFMVILIIWPAKKIPISIAINSINYPIKPIKPNSNWPIIMVLSHEFSH